MGLKSKSKTSFKNLSSKAEVQFIHHFIDHIGDEIILFSEDGCIVFANEAAIKSLGYSSKKLSRLTIGDLYGTEFNTKSWKKAEFAHIKRSKEPIYYALKRTVCREKVQTVEITATHLNLGKEEFVLMSSRIIDARLELERIQIESEKMKAVQTLIAGSVKEFQFPMKGIVDRANSLLDKFEDRDFEYIGFKDYQAIFVTLRSIRDQAKYSFDTAHRVLTLQKKRSGIKISHCDVNHVIKEIVEAHLEQYSLHQIKITLLLTKDLNAVAIDQVSLNQIVTNLINNAAQAMPSGGTIILRTKYLKDKKMCVIECKDDGVGIPKKSLTQVFEPFYTTKHRGLNKNSGLGLSIVRSIIYMFKGEIHLKSHLRTGTQINVSLPFYKTRKKV